MESSCAKGSIVVGAVVSLRHLRSSGRIADEQLAARLSRAALELLEQKIEIGRWYPMRAFAELVEFEWDVIAGRDPEYARASGAKGARRLFASRRYQQLDFAQRAGKVYSRKQLIRQARLITTVIGTFYDFLSVRVALESEGLVIIYGNALAFRDPLIHTTVGFKNQINVRQGSKARWSGKRTQPDQVCFSMPLPKRLSESETASD